MNRIFTNLKKNFNPWAVLTLPWGYIHVYDLYSQTGLFIYIYQILGERLQDHWSSVVVFYPNINCGYSLEPPRRVPTIYVFVRKY